MIVDTSAIVALLREEPESPRFSDCIFDYAGNVSLSAASYLEAAIVVDSNDDAELSSRLDSMLLELGIVIEPVTVEQIRLARQAHRQYGRGSGSAAKLNFGDCFSYALAKAKSEPLLFKGNDFTRTDVQRASDPDDYTPISLQT